MISEEEKFQKQKLIDDLEKERKRKKQSEFQWKYSCQGSFIKLEQEWV
jgi:hypothetical protein